MKPKVFPQQGGCWFCYTQDDDMVFDSEFDTAVHVSCIQKALDLDPEHPEANLMKYLLPEDAENNAENI